MNPKISFRSNRPTLKKALRFDLRQNQLWFSSLRQNHPCFLGLERFPDQPKWHDLTCVAFDTLHHNGLHGVQSGER